MDATRTLGQVIRTRRLAMGLTQEELAERIGDGVRQAEVSRLECDRVGLPRRKRLERIAAALQLSIGDLLATAGWTGADMAFSGTIERADHVDESTHRRDLPHDERPEKQRDVPSLTDLRHALVRSQELHWQSLQILSASRHLAENWDAGRLVRHIRQSS